MLDLACAFAYALFLWWFGTGAVLYLDRLPRATFRWSMLGATGVLLGGIALVWLSAPDATRAGAYHAFTGAILVWVWLEMSFYTGWVTGPRRHACAPGCGGVRHFLHALGASLHHEIAIIIGFAIVAAPLIHGPNQVALWSYVAFWAMHESARLNVLLGVRNAGEDLLPAHLAHLRVFLRKRWMNPLFPVSVTLSSAVLALMLRDALDHRASDFEATGLSLIAAVVALGLIEHWFLMLPVPLDRLWHWALGARRSGPRRIVPNPDPAAVPYQHPALARPVDRRV